MEREINISDYDYCLPQERIAKYPLEERDGSRLLVYRGGAIADSRFSALADVLPAGAMLVFNNTRVVRARILMHKPSGARIELFCLEPYAPADYERAFAVTGGCEWTCIVGNSKKWKEGALEVAFDFQGRGYLLRAERVENRGAESIVRFSWDAPVTFGQLLEILGRIPIPPYLGRDSQEVDNTRYQTVYSRFEGSVAAPTAGLHFSDRVMDTLRDRGFGRAEVTLHVGAGTFLPVKDENAARHPMHTEHFEIDLATVRSLMAAAGRIVAVGTTTVRTLESVAGLGYRVMSSGDPDAARPLGQWELYDVPRNLTGGQLLGALAGYMEREGLGKIKAATRIMITPGYLFRIVDNIITNFHQPRSTLLLLVSAFVGDDWRRIYGYALANGFRFLSYGDSSLLMR